MTSGWASLSVELLQPFMLLANLFSRYILKRETPPQGTLSFPYHTEVPRVLLFGLIGLTCSVLAPLITPFLLAYYILAYLVYRNQVIIFAYIAEYFVCLVLFVFPSRCFSLVLVIKFSLAFLTSLSESISIITSCRAFSCSRNCYRVFLTIIDACFPSFISIVMHINIF